METYLEKDGANGPAINNYILMLAQTNQKKKQDNSLQRKGLKTFLFRKN